ncbi:MAG: aminotransferase class I/II-fold pyridoxal phosphate-dependent enzyme [Alphaproteobacteria bacterium]|nr:aminotransferase class I/II-fold pyridoxal phosphate-dependent enzyme [Alphaproteobacteria bacterium]
MHNDALDRLTDYPFDRLRALLGPHAPAAGRREIHMQIGEPRHAPPDFLAAILARYPADWGKYPPANGTPELRAAIAAWCARRFAVPASLVEPERHVALVAGTREALFMAALLTVPRQKRGRRPVVLMPNPFYQVYAGAAALAGAEAVLVPATAATGFQPDFTSLPDDVLDRAAFAYLNSPSNPQGAVADLARLEAALTLARRHDFVLGADECYSEIYTAAPPAGALEAAAALPAGAEGDRLANLLVFHSLSKRSSVPGLRSGFVVGEAALIRRFLRLRQYGGAQVPLPVMHASAALWGDEVHVEANRGLYRAKFAAALGILDGACGAARPGGAFYLWLDVGDSEDAALRLWRDAAVRVLPGAYLARTGADGVNPGARYIRCALIHDLETTVEAATRLRAVLAG